MNFNFSNNFGEDFDEEYNNESNNKDSEIKSKEIFVNEEGVLIFVPPNKFVTYNYELWGVSLEKHGPYMICDFLYGGYCRNFGFTYLLINNVWRAII